MSFLQIETNAAALVMRFNRMPVNQQKGITKGLARGLLLAEDRVRRGTALKFRRGGSGLAGRLTSFARAEGRGDIEGAIGFRKTRNFPYELSQEYGAKAKGGKAMSIPISAEAKALSNRGLGPRDMGNRLTLIKGMGKALLIENRKRAGGRGGGANTHFRTDVHWVLVKSIPPRLKFRENVAASVPMISEEVMRGWREGIADA